MAELRDRWSKAEIAFSAAGAVVMPIVLLVVGNWLTAQQESAAEATRQAERLTSLLKPLASESARERRLAAEVAGYLAQKGQLPIELVPVLVDLVKTDAASSTAQAASEALARVEQNSPQLRDQIQSDFQGIPTRVYFHISNEEQRPAAKLLATKLRSALREDNVVVPGIERVAGPSNSELRYFKAAEQAEATRIADALRSLGVSAAIRDLSPRYEHSTQIRPKHFELWLGNDYKGQDA